MAIFFISTVYPINPQTLFLLAKAPDHKEHIKTQAKLSVTDKMFAFSESCCFLFFFFFFFFNF